MKRIGIEKLNDGCCERPGPPGESRFPNLDEGARLFRALGDETRLSIVRRLAEEGELCACDLICCDLAQPTISHHLKVLREAGIVNAEKRGLWVHYSLNRERLRELRSWLP
ncbi:MAG: ArsR/SmtB family transcription factor [Sphingomonadaceae bacterium]